MRYAGIEYDSIVDGYGIGATIFTQYCTHHCKGCHNPQTWPKKGGKRFKRKILKEILKYYKDNPNADHLSLSGGDPLDSLRLSKMIIKKFKKKFPNKKIWVWTGYVYEDIENRKKYHYIFNNIDYLIDGPFIEELKNTNCIFRGSSNQRIIDMKKTISNNKIILLEGTECSKEENLN